MTDSCRCGTYAGRAGLPCPGCWDHRVSPATLTLLIDKARRLEDGAYPLLKEIGDPSAAPALRALLTDPVARMRIAGVSALGWSGDEDDVALVGPLLRDSDRKVRVEAIATIAELGGPTAADLLRGIVEDLPGADGQLALCGLAWLGEHRAVAGLLASRDVWLADLNGHSMAEGVLRAAREEGWDALVQSVRARFEAASRDTDLVIPLKVALTVVNVAVRRVLPECLDLLQEQLADVIDFLVAEFPSAALMFPGVRPPEGPWRYRAVHGWYRAAPFSTGSPQQAPTARCQPNSVGSRTGARHPCGPSDRTVRCRSTVNCPCPAHAPHTSSSEMKAGRSWAPATPS